MRISNSNERIRSLIKDLGISQTEFCERTNIRKSALSNYLNGDRQPRQDQLDKIAESFHVSPAWLMGYDVPMTFVEDEKIRKVKRIITYSAKLNELITAAHGCSDEQIDIAVNTLNAFKNANKKET